MKFIDFHRRAMACLVWPYHSAPAEYRALYDMGDEDWVAFVPDGFVSEDDAERYRDVPLGAYKPGEDDPGAPYLPWALPGTAFGVCDVGTYRVFNGFVFIGRHS